MTTTLTPDTFTTTVLESDIPVVVDFTADWCPPCRAMKPVLAALSDERDDVRFVEIDVDTYPDLAARYEVLSMPTFIVFRHGEPVGKLVGARPKARFVSDLEQALAQQG